VYFEGISNASILGNLFLSKLVYYGVQATSRSSDIRVVNNVFIGDYWPYYADKTSQRGWHVDGNMAQPIHRREIPTSWAEPTDRWRPDVGVQIERAGGSDRPQVAVRPTSPLIDAGVDVGPLTGELDLAGRARVVDGHGGDKPRIDIGPVEFQPAVAPPQSASTEKGTANVVR
jgi:hypothetical protein